MSFEDDFDRTGLAATPRISEEILLPYSVSIALVTARLVSQKDAKIPEEAEGALMWKIFQHAG